ncbi:MAG: hypothetical protein ACP5HQ_06540 [Thermoprotei archaeon]
MCLVKVFEAKRSRVSEDAVLLHRSDFDRLKDEIHLSVLTSRDKPENISKSYFYLILNRLKSLGLMFEGSYSFYVAIPFSRKEREIYLERGFLAITRSKRLIVYDEETPEECSCDERCKDAVLDLAEDLGIRLKEADPIKALQAITDEILSRVSEYASFMRIPGDVLWTRRS